MIKYFLMHRDDQCGSVIIDETNGRVVGYKDLGTGLSPFLGNADPAKIKKWWEIRAVPASRAAIQEVIKKAGIINTELYLAKNLALSMTDCYWICPETAGLRYGDVTFAKLKNIVGAKIPYHNESTYDPNASLGGQMEKYWDLGGEKPVLVKESTRYYGQQSVNEKFASCLHERQNTHIPFVKYTADAVSGHGIISRCEAFTSSTTELVSAYEITESTKSANSIAKYDHYINVCTANGIDKFEMQDFMDYQTFTDFIISNTDEHLQNFGVLRDAESMKLIGPAPIYDSGNSMFFSEDCAYPYTREDMLKRSITAFYDKEEKMLSKIKNKNIVDISLLPSPRETMEFYAGCGIPEKRAAVISRNYETKLTFAKEFQQGLTISFYNEKKKARDANLSR